MRLTNRDKSQVARKWQRDKGAVMKCPLADYCLKWNIKCTLPLKQDKRICINCDYWRDSKCNYEQITTEKVRNAMRGFGTLLEQAILRAQESGSIDEKTARKTKQAGLRLSGISNAEQEDYRKISKAYDEELKKADSNKRAELKWRTNHFQKFLEDGFNPKEANELAKKLDYSYKLKMDNVFKYLREAYIFAGLSKEKAESKVRDLTFHGRTSWIEAFKILIEYHDYCYFTLDRPVISDTEYNWLKEQMQKVTVQAEKRAGRR
jgi:hypothetical protein